MESNNKKVIFFVKTSDPKLFQLVGFYKSDISILLDAGFEVVTVNRIRDLLFARGDLYFSWWFGYSIFPSIISAILRRPNVVIGVVHTKDGGGLKEWPMMKRLLMMGTMKTSDVSVFISQTDINRLGVFKPRRTELVPCTIEMEISRLRKNKRKSVILTISQLTLENIKRKRLVECLSAFKEFSIKNPEYTYLIAGAVGGGIQILEQEIERLQLKTKVRILGRISSEEKIELYDSSMCYLQPSLCEGFGLAILEAKARGLPVVSNSEPCIREVNGDSILYGESCLEWADQMHLLVNNFNKFEEMQTRGFISLERYTYASRRLRLLNILSSLR